MGSMAASAPSVKTPMPTTSSTAPRINAKNVPEGSGHTVKHKTKTISVTGSTDENASFTIFLSMVLS